MWRSLIRKNDCSADFKQNSIKYAQVMQTASALLHRLLHISTSSHMKNKPPISTNLLSQELFLSNTTMITKRPAVIVVLSLVNTSLIESPAPMHFPSLRRPFPDLKHWCGGSHGDLPAKCGSDCYCCCCCACEGLAVVTALLVVAVFGVWTAKMCAF